MARDSRLSIERYGLHAEDRRERDRQREADRRIIEAARRIAELPVYIGGKNDVPVCYYCNALKHGHDHADECPYWELRRAIEAADRGKETSE